MQNQSSTQGVGIENKRATWLAAGAGAVMLAALGAAFVTTSFSAKAADTPSVTAATPDQTRDNRRGERRERFREHMKERIAADDKHLTPDQVRDIVAGRLALSDNENLKVGKAVAKGDDVVEVEILTKSGSLVTTREISTKSGRPAWIDQRIQTTLDNPNRGPRRGHHGMARGGRGGGERNFGALADGNPNRDLKLTTDQAKKLAEAQLIVLGNPRLKVGAVKEKDANIITVDIVTVDNALVAQREINRKTGRPVRHGRS